MKLLLFWQSAYSSWWINPIFITCVLHEESGNSIHIGCAESFSVILAQAYSLPLLPSLLCSALLSSPLLSPLFLFLSEYELISHNSLTNVAYNIIINRNESASFTKQLSSNRELQLFLNTRLLEMEGVPSNQNEIAVLLLFSLTSNT